MTYQDYFKQADFEDIWSVLSGFYREDERLKTEYEKLVEEINAMPVIESQSNEKIKMVLTLLPDIRKKPIGIRMMKCITNTI